MAVSTRTHAWLDLATAGFALVFPRVLGASERFTRLASAIAIERIGYSLFTRHELGLFRILPIRTHLQFDAMGGTTMAALPFMTGRQENGAVTACAIGLGAFDLVASLATESRDEGGPGDRGGLPTASVGDMLKVSSRIALPNIAKGPIIRRPKVMAAAETLDLDALSVRTMQSLRARYGRGPLLLRLPVRDQAIILDPDDVRRVLDESPEPFATASTEKRAALAHFEPKVSLASHGDEREQRRQLNDRVLEVDRVTHHLAGRFLGIVDEEAKVLLEQVRHIGELRWHEFIDTWFTIVRRVVFGNRARHDRAVTDLTAKLRSDGNWAFLKPRRKDLLEELHRRIRAYIDRSEPGSLAAAMGRKMTGEVQAPEHQIPQWLFAFDPAAMATFRALALLAVHPHQLHRACEELDRGDADRQTHRPLLRAAILESLRLWPTTPMILRQTTRETHWRNGIMPANTGVLIFAPFFHRDDEVLPYAHTFNPDLWIEDDPQVRGFPPRVWPFVPFSGGTAHCPGQNLVLMLTSAMLAAILGDRDIRLTDPRRMPPGRLPATQDNYTLRFILESRRDRMQPTPLSRTATVELQRAKSRI